MKHATQFEEVYAARVTALHHKTDPARQRWQIWRSQAEQGHARCFRTDRRQICQETGCPWRAACLSRRAEWQR